MDSSGDALDNDNAIANIRTRVCRENIVMGQIGGERHGSGTPRRWMMLAAGVKRGGNTICVGVSYYIERLFEFETFFAFGLI